MSGRGIPWDWIIENYVLNGEASGMIPIEQGEHMDYAKWDKRFVDLAQLVSLWSKDPSTQTGAVIVDPAGRLVSTGFNGFPQSIADDYRLKDRETKYEMIVHCEVNALIFAERSIKDCTLYTHPFHSCSRCASIMIQAGIKRVVAPELEKRHIERWAENLELSKSLFREAKVEVVEFL